jgi:hypothetical protein
MGGGQTHLAIKTKHSAIQLAAARTSLFSEKHNNAIKYKCNRDAEIGNTAPVALE